MTQEYSLRCSLCGLNQGVEPTSVEDLSIAKNGGPQAVYICPGCQAKVQHESEQKFK